MARYWVINASPLIALAKVSQIHLVTELSDELIIPNGVIEEINCGPLDDPARLWVKNEAPKFVQKISIIDPIVAKWDLGLGESHVLTWAHQNRYYEAILDDRAAKTAAKALDIDSRGTLGVVLLAKQDGRLAEAKPILESLVKVGLRVSNEVMKAALNLAGEA